MQVFVDESGTKGQHPVFCMAGLIAHAETWASFADAWSRVLAEPRPVRYFKMSEASSCSGEFYRFSDGERDAKVRRLGDVINEHQPVALFTVLDMNALSETYEKEDLHPHQTQPYFWPFHVTIMAVCFELLDMGYDQRCEIFFDEQDVFGPRAKAWYPLVRYAMELQQPEAAALLPVEPLFRDDEEFVPLQAADLFAWSMRRLYSGEPEAHCGFVFEQFSDVRRSEHCQILDAERMARQIEMSKGLDPEHLRRMLDRFGSDYPPS